ncbi:MAG: hypothetical protein HQL53_05500 [Magnetococcales bacterium]|nr:hypothetical protein [Magnetococcales bacterium]
MTQHRSPQEVEEDIRQAPARLQLLWRLGWGSLIGLMVIGWILFLGPNMVQVPDLTGEIRPYERTISMAVLGFLLSDIMITLWGRGRRRKLQDQPGEAQKRMVALMMTDLLEVMTHMIMMAAGLALSVVAGNGLWMLMLGVATMVGTQLNWPRGDRSTRIIQGAHYKPPTQ